MFSARKHIFLFFILLLYCQTGYTDNVSPLDFGLSEASNGEERFWALYEAHSYAIKNGIGVDYKGIKEIYVTIPKDFKSIPLSIYNDFRDAVIYVDSPYKNSVLFYMKSEATLIEIKDSDLDEKDFSKYPLINKGTYLLIYEDENSWVKKRQGFDYGAERRDIRVLKDGIAINETVSKYNNKPFSKPKTSYIKSDNNLKTVKNLTIIRSTLSGNIVYCFSINGQNNIEFSNIKIHTPENSELFGDAAFSIKNSANVRFKEVTIDGTYSQTTKYGYGISMDNVWNSSFYKLVADAKWGIFGCYNINQCTIDCCNINRFDIHCYGKDVFMKHTTFKDNYSQFSSVYGTVKYEDCTFNNYIPCLIESSFNAYVPFNLEIRNCKMYMSSDDKRNYLIDIGKLDSQKNERSELTEKCWPNVKIEGLDVFLPKENNSFLLFYVHNNITEQKPVGYINNIQIDNISFNYNVYFKLCNSFICTSSNVNVSVKQRNGSQAIIDDSFTISKNKMNAISTFYKLLHPFKVLFNSII